MKKYRVRWIMNGEAFCHDENSFYNAMEWLNANEIQFKICRATRIQILEKYGGEWIARYNWTEAE